MKEVQNGRGNGHRPDITTRAVLDAAQQPPGEASITQPQIPPLASSYQTLRGITAELHKGMFEHGYRRAVEGGDVEPHVDDEEAIRQHAEKAARECTRDLFDEKNLHDRMHKSEHEKHLSDRRHAEQASQSAYVQMRERAVEAAQAKAGRPPNKSVWLTLGAVATVALAVSFILTFHDVFFLFSDEVISWLVSFLAAAVIGGVIAVMILADVGSDGERSATNWIGLAGGILIAVGFGAARLRDATTGGEYLFTMALMLFELGIVIGLEGIAGRLRAANREYAAKAAAEARANALLAEATAHHQHCHQRVLEMDALVKGDISYVEGRHERHFRIAELVEAMVAAGLDGYYAGLAENRGINVRARRR